MSVVIAYHYSDIVFSAVFVNDLIFASVIIFLFFDVNITHEFFEMVRVI